MTALLQALGDPAIRGWYLLGAMAVLVLPMIGLAVWYHAGIRRSAGGRALMRRQAGAATDGGATLPEAIGGLTRAGDMARDIEAGRYGDAARTMQRRVYWIVALWVLAVAAAFGLLIWADAVNRVPGRAAGAAAARHFGLPSSRGLDENRTASRAWQANTTFSS